MLKRSNLSVCTCLFVTLSLCMSACLSVCLSIYLSSSLGFCLFVGLCLSVYLSVRPPGWLCVRPSVRLSIPLSVSSVFLSFCLSARLSLFMRFSRNNDDKWMMWLNMPLHPTGIHSIFSNGRLFSFKCCNSQKYIKSRCKWSKYVNSYGKNIIFEMPKKGFYMRGVRSYYSSFFK